MKLNITVKQNKFISLNVAAMKSYQEHTLKFELLFNTELFLKEN